MLQPEGYAMVTERKADGLEDYPFRVEELTPARWWIIAYLDHPIIARAAFRAAVEQYPKARIRLRNRALVMEEHKPK